MIIHLHLLLLLLFSLLSSSISTPSITVTPTSLSKSGDIITINWSNIPTPSELDWLGIYSPPNSSHHHFIGYFFLSSSPSWYPGSGSISFPLINLRHPYQFRIFRWSQSEVDPTKMDHDKNPLPQTKHLLAQSEEVSFDRLNGPQQVHLSFTERHDEMRVIFVAGNGGKGWVKYGERKEELGKVAETVVERYERDDMCDAPANQSVGWRDPGFIHHGVMTSLKKGKRYYYKVYVV